MSARLFEPSAPTRCRAQPVADRGADKGQAGSRLRLQRAPPHGGDRDEPIGAVHCGPAVLAQTAGVRVQAGLPAAGLGGLLGGAAGAAIGFGLGWPLGRIGMLVGGMLGGLVGLVGGVIVGDLASRRRRSLSRSEADYLWDIFHDSVDTSKVSITRGSLFAAGAAGTIGNTVNLQHRHFIGNTLELSDTGLPVLVHEMGHVWQYQNGGLAYIPSSLIAQAAALLCTGSRNAAYDWRSMVRARRPWEKWNAEQQAECIGDHNQALRKCRAPSPGSKDHETVALTEPYIGLVRRSFGAPGSDRRLPGAAAGEEDL